GPETGCTSSGWRSQTRWHGERWRAAHHWRPGPANRAAGTHHPVLVRHWPRRPARLLRPIRYWSDIGAVPPAGRTGGGRRLYDARCAARLELVATLRGLGLGLADVRRVLAGNVTVAEVAATHVAALDTQIRTLRL